MIVNDSEYIFNIKTLVVLPKLLENQKDVYEYNFKYVYILDTTATSTNQLVDFINKNNIHELLFVDFRYEYVQVMDKISSDVKLVDLFTIDLASLCVDEYRLFHDKIIELYQNDKFDRIGILDPNLFELMKEKINNVYQVYLDYPKMQKSIDVINNKGVGILNSSNNEKHSFYNELSAISLENNKANLCDITETVKEFLKMFNIEANNKENIDEVICSSEVNLNIDFCNSDYYKFFKSMDAGIPCVVGNNYILKGYEKLSELIQVKSDDNINEIKQKIEDVHKNKDSIFKLYNEFREEYSKKAKESLEKFKIDFIENNNQEYEKLLTVGIPVYNVEEYLEESIKSVINAVEDNTEIIIVNDGSQDNSEEIILKYVEKYPNLVRYIKQENHGLGNVRNVIMREAKGKYIASIDSDDTINEAFFKEARDAMEKDVDMVLCDWLSMPVGNDNFETPALDEMYTFENRFKKIYYCTIMPSNCNKIMKKSLYQRIGLEFVEKLKFEDFGTNPVILNNLETIKYINKPYYEYNIRENSIMRTSAGYDMIDVIKILDGRIEKNADVDKFNKDEFIAYVYAWRAEELIINQLYGLEENERNKMIDYIYEKLDGIINKIFDNEFYIKMIDRVDEETKTYIKDRNKALLDGKFKDFINEAVEKNNYKILTPALLLYNIDNREVK